MPLSIDQLVRAGEQVGAEVASGPVLDLRDGIDPGLRADPAGDGQAVGCPCGCAETLLLQRARAGDQAAVSELLRNYRLLARTKARSYFLVGADQEDLVQEGMIGVYEAIRDYDPDRGASFRTFAGLCVTRQILSAVKRSTRLKHAPLSTSLPLDGPAPGQPEGLSLADVLPADPSADPATALVLAEEVRALQRHFEEVLSDLESQVLRHHLQGRSYEDIAAMLQRHAKSIDNAMQRIKKKLSEHLAADR